MSEFLDNAIQAHNSWRIKLRNAIDGGDIPDESRVVVDNLCDLGKWIYEEGMRYKTLAEFEELKTKHAYFHKMTSQIILLIKAGKKVKALEELDNGFHSKASYEVIQAIKKLKKTLEQK
jgi:hypothetical protein